MQQNPNQNPMFDPMMQPNAAAPFGMQQPVQPMGGYPQQDPLFQQSMMQPNLPPYGQPPMQGMNGFGMQPQQPAMQPFGPFPQPMGQQWPPPGAQQAMTPELMQQMQFEAMQWQQGQGQQGFPTQPLVRKPRKQKQPKQPKPPRERKDGGMNLKILLIVLAVAAAIGAAVYFIFLRDGGPAAHMAKIEMATLGNTYRGDALIVRNETAFNEEGVQNIEYKMEEGSVITSNDPLCHVYTTGYSTAEMSNLQDYRDQINDYQQTLLATETAYDQRMTMLENEVVDRGLEVRSLVQGARGNLTNQEKLLSEAITERQNYFRSKYASDMRLSRLYDDENTQKQRIESWIKPKFGQQGLIVSFYTDGFEQALSPALFETYTPSQVRSMINGEKPETSAADRGRIDLYRLVKKDNYAVLLLIKDKTWNPTKDGVYELTLEQFTSTKVNAKVLSYARSGGELLLRLAVVDDVTNVLYMRTCEATIGESVQCMTVPLAALYTQNGAQGVVITQNGTPCFVPVNVLSQSGGKAYIQAIQSDVLQEGMEVRLFD